MPLSSLQEIRATAMAIHQTISTGIDQEKQTEEHYASVYTGDENILSLNQ